MLKNTIDTLVDFTVEIEENRDIIVLQISDTQIIDSSQKRSKDRLDSDMNDYWATDNMEDRCFGYVSEIIKSVNPDLIIITGDMVYGEFDDKGTSMLKFVEFMEGFGIPWAPVFGNHDNESIKGVDWQSQQLEKAEHCLFKQRKLTGNGNYSVGIVQQNKLKRVFFMLDSNGCGSMSEQTKENGHSKASVGFGDDQIDWLKASAYSVKTSHPDIKLSFVFHIQTNVFGDAYSKYGFTNLNTAENPINIDAAPNRGEGDFGYIGSDLKNVWDDSNVVYDIMKKFGVDSVFVGHEHANSASVVYEGIRFQYGQKTSTYDRANYLTQDGTITTSFLPVGIPIIGGTVLNISKDDASINNAYIYYCKN